MTKILYSHPQKLLGAHLEEVGEAARVIASQHALDKAVLERLNELVKLHDFGKATRFFQAYITFKPEPLDWLRQAGNRKEDKAHTALGTLASALIQATEAKPDNWLLQLGTSILGHHTQLPTAKDVDRRFTDGARVLVKQLEDLPLTELEMLTDFALDENDFQADEDTVFEAAERYEDLFDWLGSLDLDAAAQERLQTQLLFSILLEADKAFLALSDEAQQHYRSRHLTDIDTGVVAAYLAKASDSPVNALRSKARADALEQLAQHSNHSIFTLTLPTGLGKTLTAASLALELRQRQARQVIVVLPFLSIVDQTAKVYTEVLGNPNADTMMQSHSLSDRDYLDLEDGDADFFLDTWQSSIVITTFDQVLLALLSSKSKHQMRFHHLCDAVLIFDEVQALPTHLWDVTQTALTSLSKTLGTTIVAMSATQPGFVKAAQELIPDVRGVFKHFGRYRLVLRHQRDTSLDDFIGMVINRFDELKTRRVLITLNTRASARRVYDDLFGQWRSADDCPIHFLSADVTPRDRLTVIGKLKANTNQPCLVVSTQVIEAGVDIDMDLVMRDFAPLDSLIQVAGRCNRNDLKPRCDVEIYSLLNEKGKAYSTFVYKKMDGSADISLQETRKVLESLETVPEENVLELCERYFTAIRQHDDLGQKHTEDWAYFREHLDVSKLLRGEQDNQYQFIVAERDEGDLEQTVRAALAVKDRWEKRRTLRKLAPRLAKVTVSVWAKRGFQPEDIAYLVGPFWFVRQGFYDEHVGLQLPIGHTDNSSFL